MTGLSLAHRKALAMVAAILHDATAPWWIIAGTAVALHARVPVAVDDIDVLIGTADAQRVAAMPDVRIKEGGGDERFRSRFYAARTMGGVEVEFMAGFELCHRGHWEPVWPRSRILLDIGDGRTVPVPDRAELAAMLARFGRDKDVARIALLEG